MVLCIYMFYLLCSYLCSCISPLSVLLIPWGFYSPVSSCLLNGIEAHHLLHYCIPYYEFSSHWILCYNRYLFFLHLSTYWIVLAIFLICFAISVLVLYFLQSILHHWLSFFSRCIRSSISHLFYIARSCLPIWCFCQFLLCLFLLVAFYLRFSAEFNLNVYILTV